MKKVNSYKSNNANSKIILNANENYSGLDNDTLLRVKALIDKVEYNRYPEDSSLCVKEAYAKYANVKKENIIVGHGSDEMLGLIIGLNISQGKKLLTISPDFSMYDYYVSMNSGEVVKYKTNADGSFDIDEFIKFGKSQNVDLVIFSNPNNPTGHALKNEEILKIVEAFNDKYVVVDEAYCEFNDETMIDYINKYDNLLITRTLSKAWGLASLRVGFLIAQEKVVAEFSKYKVPYNVNTLSQVIAAEVVSDIDKLKENIDAIIKGREFLYSEFKKIEKEAALKVEFYDSKANYIYGRTPYKEALLNRLNVEGIIIRNFDDDSFRVTVGSPFENRKVVECFKSVFMYGGRENWQTEVLV